MGGCCRSFVGFIFLYLVNLGQLGAQVQFTVWSDNYFQVSSYLGRTTPERFNSFQFNISGQGTIVPRWSIGVRVLEPIVPISGGPNRSGRAFPSERISLQWTLDDNQSVFSLAGIGASRNPIKLQSSSEVRLIESSGQPLASHGSHYVQYRLFGLLKVEPGKYLEEYLSTDQYRHIKYRIPLVFTLYDAQGKVLGMQRVNYEMQMPPNLSDGGMVDVEPDFGFFFSPQTATANLEFRNSRDYAQGVSLTINDALKVNSATDFEVRVSSMDSEFRGVNSSFIPVSILSVQLLPGQGSIIQSNPRTIISQNESLLASCLSSDKGVERRFHLEYQAKPTIQQIKGLSMGSYQVSILYLLLPR